MKFSTIIFVVFSVLSCSASKINLKNGDLLFVGNSSGNLSKAIDEVTKTEISTNFSHIALVEKSGNGIWVLHAAPENGSERIKLDEFITYARKDSSEIVVYRIKREFNPDFENAISEAKNRLGKPYNFTYILSDSAYYCSDFVYHSFEKDSIFEMNPMTFKNPETDEFHPTWIEFYQKQNLEIPEGKPGCNPNGMAASDKLDWIGVFKY